MRLLGISAFYHDSAAALVVDGEIVAAAQEERFTRKKHDAGFPDAAARWCLGHAGIRPADLDYVVFYEKPFLKFERLLETYLAFAPRGFSSFRTAIPLWVREKLFQKQLLVNALEALDPDVDWIGRILFTEHHEAHAASAFFPSPFERAAVLTMDGVGEWTTTSLSHGDGSVLRPLKEQKFPHSLGLLYSAFTYYAGFKVNSGEYKVMGLAPYGRPVFADRIFSELMDLKEDGTFRLDLSYFDYCTGLTMTAPRFDAVFGGPPRAPESLLTQREMDLAASIQLVTEEVVSRLVKGAVKDTGERNLCLAGGVALNCVANGKLLREGLIDDIWIQPAAGDAGGALGAALAAWYRLSGSARHSTAADRMQGSFLGPAFTSDETISMLTEVGARFEVLDDDTMISVTADALRNELAVGWMQGRMEYGPRALGARSILADPRSPSMQSVLNRKIKYRESFRPFAPAVLREELSHWFELDRDSPYMLLVADIAGERRKAMTPEQEALFGIEKLDVPRSSIPSVTHVDYSARIQTVHADTNPRFHALLTAFHALTGCPVLVNTSFNVRSEPIVCTPGDAFRCFMGTELDLLVVGNCVMRKAMQDPGTKRHYADAFQLD